MPPARLRDVALLLTAAAVVVHGQQGPPAGAPWPTAVQQVPAASPPLSPADALKTFSLPPGYRVELVASEPLVQDPVAIDWDPEGRLWVVEMPGYMRDVSGAGEHDPIGRIVVLEDGNGDGRMDSRTVFADGLVMARALKVLDRGVLVGEPPDVWLMRDIDGDLRMDVKARVTNQYGRRDTDPQNNANSFYWALDNRLHTAGQAAIQLRLERGVFVVDRTLPRGQWGVTQDDVGRIYRNTNESALHVDLVPTAYFARHPHLLRTRGSYERLADLDPELNTVWPIRPNPGTNRAYQSGIDRADGTLARFTAVCAPLVYRGDRLPPELHGDVFVAEPAANLVSRIVLDDDGTTLRARKAYARGEFLASTDERFRPVHLSGAPDGTLYVVDMYRGVLEHRLSLTEYLRDQIRSRRLEAPTGLGRIYRVVHTTTRRDARRVRPEASTAELVALLSHESGWWRDTAQRRLVERGGTSGVPALSALARSATDPRVRLHALWTLDGLDAIEPAMVVRALADDAPDVRRSAVRLAERWLGEPHHPLHDAVIARTDDADWSVRRQLAASLGALPAGVRDAAVAALLERHGGDPIALDAALSGLRGSEATVLDMLLRAGKETPPRAAAITMLSATIVRGAQDAAVQRLFERAAENDRAAWQRSALVRGVEVALVGAEMPGTPVPRRAEAAAPQAPCPTCPGGRAGPGGAYAFPRPDATAATGGGRGGPLLRLNREPAVLSALAARGGGLGTRVARLLARVTWPGKPGETALTPLTSDEQQRFDAGSDIYRNLCQACHQPDGRGLDPLAPGLVGSALTLARSDIAARILLHGKEGVFGLMPPMGSTLTDEQVASVLTYVRREWGQAGTPVDRATVTAVRALTADRTRPWTDAELVTLSEPGGGARRPPPYN